MAISRECATAIFALFFPLLIISLEYWAAKKDPLALEAPCAQRTSVVLSREFPLRVLPLLLFPALSLFPGHTPAQEARWAAVWNLDMSVPITERMLFAEFSPMPGISVRRSTSSCISSDRLSSIIVSKWCNWELGYGDAQKYRDHIALFSLKPKSTYDWEYKGSEYMLIYPYVSYYNGIEKYMDGNSIPRGYYISMRERNLTIIPLINWLKSR